MLREFINQHKGDLFIRSTGNVKKRENIFGLVDHWLIGKTVKKYEDSQYIGYRTSNTTIAIAKGESNG